MGLFSDPKKKTLNAHISKSLLAPKGLFSKTLQYRLVDLHQASFTAAEDIWGPNVSEPKNMRAWLVDSEE